MTMTMPLPFAVHRTDSGTVVAAKPISNVVIFDMTGTHLRHLAPWPMTDGAQNHSYFAHLLLGLRPEQNGWMVQYCFLLMVLG